MLMRSSSTPILNSWLPQSKESIPEIEHIPVPQIFRTRSNSFERVPVPHVSRPRSRSFSVNSSPTSDDYTSAKRMTQALYESDVKEISVMRKNPFTGMLSSISVEESMEEAEVDHHVIGGIYSRSSSSSSSSSTTTAVEKLFSSSGLDVEAGGGIGGDGGKICCGGGRWDGGDQDDSSESNQGKGNIEAYYQTMVQANPGNSLILANYARYLKEVKCELEKAEEYCGRAILANPGDGNVLSLYADIIWQSHKDASRAESYFDQAVQAAPDDCYVMASYARFLWDAEEDEEEEEEEEEEEHVVDPAFTSYNNTAFDSKNFHGSPLTAAY